MIFVILMLSIFSGALAQQAGTPYIMAPQNFSHSIILKLNTNYLLFSYPISPYVDKNESVMVPLRVVGELMGGQVYYSKQQKKGTIIRTGLEESHLLEFTSGLTQARFDDEVIKLKSAPIWISGEDELLVPLAPLIEAFNLNPHWSDDRNILVLSDVLFEGFESFELETLPDSYQDTERLLPSGLSFRRQGSKSGQIQLSVDLKNISNSDIPLGQQGLFLLAQYNGIGGAAVRGIDTDVPTIGPKPKDPCFKIDSKKHFVCKAVFPAFSSAIYNTISGTYPIDYIVARVRLRTTPSMP